jgi:RHS repeat-associated protein
MYDCSILYASLSYKFTGKERDAETGDDYFGARYYASTMARFMSPDSKNLALRHLLNPQKLNKYTYVLDNPLALFDPNGEEEVTITYRAFIPTATTHVGPFVYAGDNRGFSTAPNASSRVSLSVTIETDPNKNPSGLVKMGKPEPGLSMEYAPQLKLGEASQGLPHANVARDSNGNVVVTFQSDSKNPLGPLGEKAEPGIRADATVKISPDGTEASAGGIFSGYPSHEINMTDSSGTVPLLQVPAGGQATDLFKNTVVPPQETVRPPQGVPNSEENN